MVRSLLTAQKGMAPLSLHGQCGNGGECLYLLPAILVDGPRGLLHVGGWPVAPKATEVVCDVSLRLRLYLIGRCG